MRSERQFLLLLQVCGVIKLSVLKMIQCVDCGQDFSCRLSLADYMQSVHVDLPHA